MPLPSLARCDVLLANPLQIARQADKTNMGLARRRIVAVPIIVALMGMLASCGTTHHTSGPTTSPTIGAPSGRTTSTTGPRTIGGTVSSSTVLPGTSVTTGVAPTVPVAHLSSSSSTRPSPASLPVPASLQAQVQGYLAAREDAAGADRSSPSSWVSTAQNTMTAAWAAGQKSAAAIVVPGWEWRIAHQMHWHVAVKTSCQVYTDTGMPTANSMVVVCNLADTTLGQNNQPVSPTQLPALWPCQGPRPSVTLAMVRRNGDWLVNQDLTMSTP